MLQTTTEPNVRNIITIRRLEKLLLARLMEWSQTVLRDLNAASATYADP